ncbi:MAG: hypothetical protein COU08_01460 [Candidatus Harrisonbacteria bacterium CG10_big_fil_rev_8_21_14_0_10_42_17]|uniref:Dihydrofolate reductase n=1 Tax=Candidatus Harrisonbacteria bacterium CG10_big_fil_rev_8_21_14_0_10_42_17 TaxID=1974584 RepID=A0A2M6WIP9_9BACT|nr:MAG: hypothetical protein COU08_01460 [Candidatus Harrisonbacteria bacterium CG10_big_fil_rev_8_21_14_0_10_42_17]
MISIIAAVAMNNVIGKNNKLLWHIPEDLKRFKKLTEGNVVMMGRATLESIVSYIGEPLPDRTNVVITRNKNYKFPEGIYPERNRRTTLIYSSLDTALEAHKKDNVFIAGGGKIYKAAMNYADQLLITHVDKSPEGDTYFPVIDQNKWKKTEEEQRDGYRFVTYKRK